MGRKIDLTGQRFGKWTVLSECKDRSNGSIKWLCRCDCGSEKEVNGQSLRRGKSMSCGCDKKYDLTGKQFGKWRVISEIIENTKCNKSAWRCVCECGEISNVFTRNLISGSSKSCGCSTRLDLTFEKYGKLTVMERLPDRLGRSYWECECECGNKTNAYQTHLISGQRTSCGCALTERVLNQFGENNPNYNSNLTDVERMSGRYQLHGKSISDWRNTVFHDDDHVCQSCNKRGSTLNAHHLNAWNAFPEQRFDTANGITLCKDCHKDYHHFNGRGDNTLEEFRDHLACTVGEEHVLEIEEVLLSRESEIIGQEQPTRELQTT